MIRLLARGAAGYRTAAKALQYAMIGAGVSVESLSEPDASGVRTAAVRVQGQLRDSGEAFTALATLHIGCTHRELTSVDVLCSDDELARIAASRRA